MTSDQLQLLALVLEMAGLWLAYCHIFTPDFSAKLSRGIRYALIALGAQKLDYAMPGVDYDDDIADEDKGAAALGYLSVMITAYLCWWYVAGEIELGDGGWFGALEVALALLVASIITMPVHLIFAAAINLLDMAIVSFGGGCYSASLGFILAVSGVCIEIYQVASTSFGWVLLLIPIAAFIALIRSMHRRL